MVYAEPAVPLSMELLKVAADGGQKIFYRQMHTQHQAPLHLLARSTIYLVRDMELSMRGGEWFMKFSEETMGENGQSKIAEMMENKYEVHVRQFERSSYFGNLMLIVETGKSILRFVRDRGYNTCEICDDIELRHWIDDVFISFSDPIQTESFYNYVEFILTLKGMKKD